MCRAKIERMSTPVWSKGEYKNPARLHSLLHAEAGISMTGIRRNLQIILCAFLLGHACCASASDAAGKIVEIAINKELGPVVFIRLDASPASPATCSTHTHWHYTLALASETEKRMYAVLLAAQLAGKSVNVGGTGACTDFNSVES